MINLAGTRKAFAIVAADEAEFYIPTEFLQQSEDNRQASAGPLASEDQHWPLLSTHRP
jgi:hypothetical protein